MKFLAQLELVDGSKIILPLKCREYHANKLQYVLGRTLDRSVFKDAHVLAVEGSAIEKDAFDAVLNIGSSVPFDLKLVCREVKNER